MISDCLQPSDRSVIDLGCNVGEFTRRCADEGKFALGLDKSRDAIKRAQNGIGNDTNVAFGVSNLDLSALELLPRFDVCLCLSVCHLWYKDYGEEFFFQMLRQLANSAGKLIFEPASIHSKYGPACTLPFEDNDEDSVRDYFLQLLSELADRQRKVSYLGSTPGLGKEKFRLMFSLT
jgi:SAM-dependent methyltransferase